MEKEKIIEQVEKEIDSIVAEGIEKTNLDFLGKLVDIHKDLKNEEYWKNKKEVMEMNYRGRYGNDYERDEYGIRGRGRQRDSRGRYSERGRYRGEDAMEEMMEYYENYNESSEEMYRGNYGAEGGMIQSVEGIMKNIYEIVEELSEADSPEVMRIIKRYSKKIEEME